MIINEWHHFLLAIYPMVMLRVGWFYLCWRYRRIQNNMKKLESRHRQEMTELIQSVLEEAEEELSQQQQDGYNEPFC